MTTGFTGDLRALVHAAADQVSGSDERDLLRQFVERSFGNSQHVSVTARQVEAAARRLEAADNRRMGL